MKRIFTLLGLLIFLSVGVSAQELASYQERGLFPHETRHEGADAPAFKGVDSYVLNQFKASGEYNFNVMDVDSDELGFTHYRLQQTYQGVPIEKSMLLVHVKDGKVVSSNGEWFSALPGGFKAPGIGESAALTFALNKVGAKQYVWESEEAESLAKDHDAHAEHFNFEKPKGKLVYMTVDNALEASSLRLAYKFDIFALDPFVQRDVYIDANDGSVIFTASQLHDVNAPATAVTGYYGSRSITADQSGGRYYTRQNGARSIEVYDMNGRQMPQGGRPSGTTISSTSSTFNFSGNARYYMDAYWGAEVTVDFFKEKFNRNSYNGAGGKIDIYVNASGQGTSNNAFWYGSFAYFGNATSGTPFTSLDIVSHEITHGVTGNSARLIYQGESGALNEAFSDIFGAYAEHYANVGQKWTMGEYISFQRSMSNPNQYRHPDTYRGTYWASTSGGDNGGVHTNSGVLNHWFYLASEGGSGSNDNGASFSVNGIGIEKAAQVAYRALTRYLTASSNYSAARTAVINSARDLYGNGSCEEAAVTDAMAAVGVGSKYSGNCSGQSCDAIAGLSASSVTSNSALISWSAVSGVSSYTLEYKAATAANYTTVTTGSASRTLSGLASATTYNVRVRYTCSNGQTAEYATTSFTTSSTGGGCNAVSGLSVSNISKTGASVSWSGVSGVSSYSVQYKASTASGYTSVSSSGTTATLSNLSAGTSYDVRVNYTCSNGQSAPYASSSFTTNSDTGTGCNGVQAWSSAGYYNAGEKVVYNDKVYEALNFIYYYPPTDTRYWRLVGDCDGGNDTCDAVSSLSVSSVGQTSANVSWGAVSGVSSYTLEYKAASASNYTSVTTSSASRTLSGLTASTTYNVRVRYTCSNGQTAAYATTSFTTSGGTTSCNAVTGLGTTSVTSNSAQISWNGVSGVSSYTLEYKATSDATYQSATINGTSEPYTGLAANTSYTVRVTYTCSNGSQAPYATHTFTTSGGTGGGCDGIPAFEEGKTYFTGDRVVYNGSIYEAQIDYLYWSPIYGWWTLIGSCGSASFAALPGNDTRIDLDVYPNPATSQINLQFYVKDGGEETTTIRLINAIGKVAFETKVNVRAGINYVPLQLPALKPGLYMIQQGEEVKRVYIKQ